MRYSKIKITGLVCLIAGAILLISYPAYARRVKDFSGEVSNADDIFIYADSGQPFSSFGKKLPPEIRLVKELPEGDKINCLGYLIGEKKLVRDILRFRQFISEKGYKEFSIRNSKPRVGDIVRYSTTREDRDFHVGKITRIDEDGTIWVESKWCIGPVFEHTLNFVPSRYDPKHALFYGPPR